MEENFNISDGVEPNNTATQQLSLQFRPRSNSETSDDFKSNTRKTTDLYFLGILTTFLVVFLCCLCYCIANGDIYRILNGYDNCGNVCGKRKTEMDLPSHHENTCSKEEILPPHQIILRNDDFIYSRLCVSNCSAYPGYRESLNKCIPDDKLPDVDNFLQEISDDFKVLWPQFCFLCLIAFGLSIIVLILLRYFPNIVVWVNMICIPLSFAGGAIFLWMMVVQDMNMPFKPGYEKITTSHIAGAIGLSVTTLILTLVIIVMRKRIRLVVQLLKEASKAIIAMPIILFIPILTFVFLVVIAALWFYFVLWIESSGQLEESRIQSALFYYEQNGFIQFTRWYNLVAMMWMVQFVIGCQDMVVAGAISKWYFARNKDTLRATSTIFDSFYNLMRYHLGSVAFGSFVITVIRIIRILLKLLQKKLERYHLGICIQLCIRCTESGCSIVTYILKYLTRNAYIQVATHGCTFYEGGKRAFTLLSSNLFRVVKINSVGDFVLFQSKLLVVTITVLIGVKMLGQDEDVQHKFVPICIAAIFAYVVAHGFVTIYEITVDTIFLCFCEDCEENDGITKQYYMSKNLMEFVENSKKIIEAQEAKRSMCQS